MTEPEGMTNEEARRIDHYNPVTVTVDESTGTFVLAAIALILLFALLRSQRRVRELLEGQNQEGVDLVPDSKA